jgi:hydrogenase maturation protease
VKRVIIGLGNPLKQDDNIGNIVAKRLGGVAGATAPENYMPHDADEIVLMDAVLFDGEPGEVKEFSEEDVQGFFHSTHNLPLSLFKELNPHARIRVIGIMPSSTDFGETLTPKINSQLETIVSRVKELLL